MRLERKILVTQTQRTKGHKSIHHRNKRILQTRGKQYMKNTIDITKHQSTNRKECDFKII